MDEDEPRQTRNTWRLLYGVIATAPVGLVLLLIGREQTSRGEFVEALSGVEAGRHALEYVGWGVLLVAAILLVGVVVGYATQRD